MMNLLEKIKYMIYNLSPSTNKIIIKIELDEFIDIEFINQKLKYNVMSKTDIMNLFYYIWEKITFLQASVRDIDSIASWKDIQNDFQNNDLSLKMYLKNIL
jgi:hypothetical protein